MSLCSCILDTVVGQAEADGVEAHSFAGERHIDSLGER